MRETIYTLKDVKRVLNDHKGQAFAFDVETSGLTYMTDELLGVALRFENGNSFYIVLSHTQGEPREHYRKRYIDPHQLGRVLSHLFAQDVLMIAHNAKFDMHFLHRFEAFIKGRLADTLLAAQLLDENRENGLKALAANLLNMPYAKYASMKYYFGFEPQAILATKLEDVAEYAMNDVEATWLLWEKFHPQLAEDYHKSVRLLDIFNDIWMPLLVTLQQMEARGIAVDIDLVHEIRKDYILIRDTNEKIVVEAGMRMIREMFEPAEIPALYLRMATEEEIEEAYTDEEGRFVYDVEGTPTPIITSDMVGKTKTYRPRVPEFNTGSPNQIHDLVFEFAKMTIPEMRKLKKSEKTGKYAGDKDNLKMIVYYNGTDTPEFINSLLEWRKADKFINTYLDVFIEKGDMEDYNAIHTWFAMAVGDNGSGGTATGRLSSSGPNLQNIPSRGEVGKRARQMFVRRPKTKLLVTDLGQAELRILAHYSQDPALMKAFEDGQDLHVVTGAGLGRMSYEELLKLVEDEDPEGKKLRMLGKTANFGLTYGMGAFKFQRFILVENGYEVTEEEAQNLIDLYNETYHVAQTWKQVAIRRAHTLGYTATLYGRKRRLPNLASKNRKVRSYAERQGVNAIIQGSVGDIICEAMIRIQPELVKLDGTLLLQVHDELVAEVPEENAEKAKELIERMMIEKCNPMLRVPQIADCGIGDTWADAKG